MGLHLKCPPPYLTQVLNPCSLDAVLFAKSTEPVGGGATRDGPVRVTSSQAPDGHPASHLL